MFSQANKDANSLFSGGLLSNTSSASGIFGQASSLFATPSNSKKNGEEGSDGDDDAEKEVDPTGGQPTKLKIESRPPPPSPFTKEYNQHVEKVKVIKPTPPEGQKGSRGSGMLSLERAELGDEKKVLMWMLIFRNTFGKALFQGSIAANSMIKQLENKPSKVQLKAAILGKNSEGKYEQNHIVISFGRSDERTQFEKEMNRAITELKARKDSAADKK